eukprot:7389626-Heterocapsa_arctica.AAC.1
MCRDHLWISNGFWKAQRIISLSFKNIGDCQMKLSRGNPRLSEKVGQEFGIRLAEHRKLWKDTQEDLGE